MPVEITGLADQASLARLYDLLQALSPGRPLDVTLDGQRGGLNALENAAIRQSLPPGYTAHRVPAGHVVAPAADELPDALGDVHGIAPELDAILIELTREVPVGQILASLPTSIRDRAVVHVHGEPPLPLAWVPAYLRDRQSSKRQVPASPDTVRRAAFKVAVIRAAVERMRTQPLTTPMPAVAPAVTGQAIQLANLGHAGTAADRLANEYEKAAELSQRELLREAGIGFPPPPVRLGGGAEASTRHHANTAILQAVRLTLAGELGQARLEIQRNRTAFTGKEQADWLVRLREFASARPDHAQDLSELVKEVMTC
jgi:hypothetical protein